MTRRGVEDAGIHGVVFNLFVHRHHIDRRAKAVDTRLRAGVRDAEEGELAMCVLWVGELSDRLS